MKKLLRTVQDWFLVALFYLSGFAGISAFILYIVGIFCVPAAIVWAIYKLVTHATAS